MPLTEIEHQGRRWAALAQPVVSREVESGLEIVFVAKDDGEKYASPVGMRLLQAISEGGLSLDHHRLRKMLRRAMESGRRPTCSADRGGPSVLSKVRTLLD